MLPMSPISVRSASSDCSENVALISVIVVDQVAAAEPDVKPGAVDVL